MAADCVFCNIVSGDAEGSIVHADDLVVAFMDIMPVNPGHCLVVPREHATDLSDLPEQTAAQMMRIGHRIALAVHASPLGGDGLNLGLAHGRAAGQTVFHAHLHVIPRTRGDGVSIQLEYGPRPQRTTLDQHAEAIATSL